MLRKQVASKGIKVIAWIVVDETEKTEFHARDHQLPVSDDTDRDLILRYQSFFFQWLNIRSTSQTNKESSFVPFLALMQSGKIRLYLNLPTWD